MIKSLSILSITLSLIFSAFVFLSIVNITYSAVDGSNVVINEVQIIGSSASDEFVELYNPTELAIDLSGWRLTRYSSTGTESNLSSSLSGTINPNSYYLVAHADYDGEVSADESYTTQNNIASNGAVRLYSDAGITIVDTLGFGTGTIFETQTIDNPATDGSVTRTNFIDSDNNFNDFSQIEISDPQNSASVSATPTSTPEPTDSPTPSPTSTPTPTQEPTVTPTESPTPTPSVSATPTSTPTATPTVTPTPTPVPSDAPVRTRFLARFGDRVCRLEYRYVSFGFRRIAFPRIVCS